MLNIREKAPVILFAILAVAHLVRIAIPETALEGVYAWLALTPLDTQDVTLAQSFTSLAAHGFVHADAGHLFMNGFMIVAFGVATLQGLRADIRMRPQLLSPVQKFYVIFILGVIGGGIFQWGWWSFTGNFALAIGASGGASAFFAAMAYAIGGRERMLKFGLGWLVINIMLALLGPSLGINIAWAAHIGGYVFGMILARYWVRPKSTAFKIN